MKIIGIVGILDFPRSEDRVWRRLRTAFSREFLGADFIIERCLYLPWQGARMRCFAKSILEKYDTGEEIMLVGYSLGGLIACTIAPRFKKSLVCAVVTIGAPHKLNFFYRLLENTPYALSIPVHTFAGILDPIVPWFVTQYPNDIHTNLFADHLISFVLSDQPARKVAQVVKRRMTEREH